MSLDELLNSDGDADSDDGDDGSHLACGCRPSVTICGVYQPWVSNVDLISVNAPLCQPCLNVWHAGGCGACPCGPGNICQACIESAAQ